MSMVVKVSVVVNNLNILKKAVRRMGYRFRTLSAVNRTGIEGFTGNEVGMISNKRAKRLCYVTKTAAGYILKTRVRDFQRHSAESTLNRIKQTYVLEEVMKTAQENGWTALSQTEKNGTMRIRLAV